MQIVATLASVAAIGVLAWRWRADALGWRQWRDHLLRPCEKLIFSPIADVDSAGWPRLDGSFEGYPVSIEVLLDDAGYRKLPVLWIRVSAAVSRRDHAAFCATARPNSNEYWSAHASFSERMTTPTAWPNEVSMRGDRLNALPQAVVDASAEFFAAPSSKELLISHNRIQVIAMAMQSRRPEYLVLRAPRFESDTVNTDHALMLLRHVTRIARADAQTFRPLKTYAT